VPRCEPGEDIVYSPNKYRETEGVKEIKQRVSLVNQCLENGMTDTQLIKWRMTIRGVSTEVS